MRDITWIDVVFAVAVAPPVFLLWVYMVVMCVDLVRVVLKKPSFLPEKKP